MTDLLIIAPLPPHASDSALLAHAVACHAATECLAASLVIEDLAPDPAPEITDRFQVIRRRDLVARQAEFLTTPRLYIIGNSGDCLFALELFRQAPGAVLLANDTLFDLIAPALETAGTWPDRYWQWLHEWLEAPQAASLYGAKLLHLRETAAQAMVTPGFDLLLGEDATVLAPSPYAARQLAASGLEPAITWFLAPAAATQEYLTDSGGSVLVISEEKQIAADLAKTLKGFDATQHVEVAWCHRFAPETAAKARSANIIVLLDGNHASACPHLAAALHGGKPVVTAGQGFAAHLPEGTQLAVPHKEAGDSLTLAVAALLADPNLRSTLAGNGARFAAAVAKPPAAQALLSVAAAASATALKLPVPARAASSAGNARPLPDSISSTKQLALIGAPPPSAVLSQLLPALDVPNCPRFATPAIANRLAEIGGDTSANMLARTGYEALLIAAEDGAEGHRPAQPWPDVASGLLFGDKAISFACTVADVPAGDTLLTGQIRQAKLPIRIPFSDRRDAPTNGYIPSTGLFWRHDMIRNQVTCIMLVGGEDTFTLVNESGALTYLVADQDTSLQLAPGDRGVLRSDGLGVLEFRIAGFDRAARTLAQPQALRKALADEGAILEWSHT